MPGLLTAERPVLLSVRDLTCMPPGAGETAFRGLAFEVEAGETVALTGPRGAGKTTALRVLAGLVRDYTGAVDFQGRELKDWSRDFYLRIGASLESPLLQGGLTARENLEVAAGLYPSANPAGRPREAIPALLERLGLGPVAGKRAADLGAEERKKLSLARAFFHRPDLLLLDEPFENLSPASLLQVMALLDAHREAGGAAVLAFEDAYEGAPAYRTIPVAKETPAGSR